MDGRFYPAGAGPLESFAAGGWKLRLDKFSNSLKTTLFAALLAGLAAMALGAEGPAAPQGATGAAEPERWDWTGSVAAGKAVRVENPWGDVRARFGGYEGGVEIHAVLQRLQPGLPPLQVFTETTAAGLVIRVARTAEVPPEPARSGVRDVAPPKAPADRVDLVVRVPKGSPLQASTRAGTLEAKGLQSDVALESESGAISVREVRGFVRTRNVYGATEVVLGPFPGAPEQTFDSLTGDISVTLPPRANCTVRAKTSGWITTDISLRIVRRPKEEPSKTAVGRVGPGASPVTIRTRRGNVQILQMEDPGPHRVAPGRPESPVPDTDGE